MRKMTVFSLSILPSDDLRRLGFSLLDEFLVSLNIWCPIQFHGVGVVDQAVVLTLHMTNHASGRDHMECHLLLWKRGDDSFFALLARLFLRQVIITLNTWFHYPLWRFPPYYAKWPKKRYLRDYQEKRCVNAVKFHKAYHVGTKYLVKLSHKLDSSGLGWCNPEVIHGISLLWKIGELIIVLMAYITAKILALRFGLSFAQKAYCNLLFFINSDLENIDTIKNGGHSPEVAAATFYGCYYISCDFLLTSPEHCTRNGLRSLRVKLYLSL